MALSPQQVASIKKMNHDELVSNAQSQDLGVLVEATWRLHRTTWLLNAVLIVLTVVLITLTAALVYAAFRLGHA